VHDRLAPINRRRPIASRLADCRALDAGVFGLHAA
jgi:hypothetical protein